MIFCGVTQTDFYFTGQRGLAAVDLADYNARWYSQQLGRFTQPDTLIPDPGNPQSFNRYSYVQNSPLNFVDPSGHRYIPLIDGVCGSTQNCWIARTHHDPDSVNTKTADDLGLRGGEEDENLPENPVPSVPTLPNLPPEGYISDLLMDSTSVEADNRPSLDSLGVFWDEFASPVFSGIDAYNFYEVSRKGGWKYLRLSLPTGPIEGFFAGRDQFQRDNDWRPGLSSEQKYGRAIAVGLETWAIDGLATLAGGTAGAIATPAGPVVMGGAYLAGSSLVTIAGEKFIKNTLNPYLFPIFNLGIFP